jgi:glycosyltransferase involved in cell wall biosynthesis
VVYTGYYAPQDTFKGFANVDVRVLNPTTVKRTMAGTLKSALQIAKQEIPDEGFDAVAVWCDGLGDLIAFKNHNLPLFNICSTPLRAAFDPVYEQESVAGKSLGYKIIYQVFKYAFRTVDRLAWRYFDGVMTTSQEVKNRIIRGDLCTDLQKMVMAYPGIDYQENISDCVYQPFVLLSGRIMWTKNLQQAIQAFVAANLPKPWKLVIAGFLDEKSKPYLETLKAMVPKHVNVEFVISPDDDSLRALYQQAAFCVFPPLNEDWGIVPLEAMNYGKPVIANASGGPLESVIDGKTGFLLQAEDMQGWTEAIRRLALNPALCQQMGQQAHQHVEQYRWENFVERVDDAFEYWTSLKQRKVKEAKVNRPYSHSSHTPLGGPTVIGH